MALRKDVWRPAIVRAPIERILAQGSLEGLAVHWLPPQRPFRFLADPFGLWRDGRLHVFVECYDYRVRIGRIDVLTYDAELRLREQRPALSEPWHLSYPQLIEAEGETWMLPEASKAGKLLLYRAVRFPDRWERAFAIDLQPVPIDATLARHEGRWWLFYAGGAGKVERVAALHLAWAERLTGPWHPHPCNPVRFDIASARPGGTPVAIDGRLVLPVQDCTRTYGGAIRPLRFERLSGDAVVADAGPALAPRADFHPYVDGLHTLSAAGEVTLIDVKRRYLSPRSLAIDARWEAGAFIRRATSSRNRSR